ncbi:primosomal protein N' [Candidatus Saccharibacteria bacterium]|nr:primosomal protein N' [Candidatus Saccharibacteria bacterium]
MQYYLICPVGVFAGTQDVLTYSSKLAIKVGSIVVIPFGTRTKLGVVLDQTQKPSFTTKPIDLILPYVLPRHLLLLADWISTYYVTRLSFIMQMLIPTGITKKRRKVKPATSAPKRSTEFEPLTLDQKSAITRITNSEQTTHLLHGITGSGKTRVYQELAKTVISEGKSVLILVPEIALTPQLSAEFDQLHKNVLVMHSGLTEAQRHVNWHALIQSDEPWILVGPRSTLFSPLKNIGLIVIDEAHEPSYQQDSQPKYNALRVARKLADLSSGDVKLILGSATPAVADYYLAEQTHTPIIEMFTPTMTRNTSVEVVDMRDRQSFGTHSLFSKKLILAMNNAVAQNEQILLFHNRRGTARMSLCSVCGWSALCPNCHISLRLHHDSAQLQCHTCGHKDNLPQTCPECSSPDIEFKGFGSKRIEAEVQKLYSSLTIARFDSDTKENQQLHHRYQELYNNEINILIGTQGIAKGLDLPHLSTVGIIQADSELFIPDFSSSERAFQLTTQVIGRVGRRGQKSSVIVQTLNPDHPAIVHAVNQDYAGFYSHELKERQAEHMPPFTFILHLTAGYASKLSAEKAAMELAKRIQLRHPSLFIRGPAPAFHEHKGSQFYQQLIISSSDRSTLTEVAKSLPPRWHFTLDPTNLL